MEQENPLNKLAKNIISTGLVHPFILHKVGEDYVKENNFTKEAGDLFKNAAFIKFEQERLSDNKALKLMKLMMQPEETWQQAIKDNEVNADDLNNLVLHFPTEIMAWLAIQINKTDDPTSVNINDWYHD